MAAESSNAAADAKLWPDPIEKKFILFLLEEAINGNTPFDWQHVAKVFNEQSGKNHSPQQLKDKHKRLKMKYEAFSHLISRSDMKYDPATNTVTGNEMAWFNAVKVSVIHLINFHAVYFLNSSCKQSHIYQCL